jgi:hypothetical protein
MKRLNVLALATLAAVGFASALPANNAVAQGRELLFYNAANGNIVTGRPRSTAT